MTSRLRSPVKGWEARRALRTARRRADEEIAATRLPPPRLAWRTAELVADENRVALARSLTDVVHAADERLLPTATPIARGAVRDVRPQLLEVASLLYDMSRPVTPRGVLMVERLLTDGTGPLYGETTTERLRAAVERALAALGGQA
ncbi:MAG TPA: hypothetical protein VI408_16055 [Gaiellaceae bacterium]